ncbi:hypothetical protein [Streptacidiphilus albus]|uniref:hypothetical protein n=1 Tax=Streptacidiphilus albus TaxID=105425 RepID=UPI00068BE1D5|nr:hypothetical protein [Streptacidiphilus albus]
MAARRTDLVQADPDSSGRGVELAKTTDHNSFVPGLRADEGEAPELLDATQELFSAGQSPEDILAEPPDARDIAAELSAPPRRKLPWLTLILAAGVIAAGSFWGGAMVQKNSGSSSSGTAASFAARFRSGAAGGAAGGATGGAAAGGFGRAGGTGGGSASGTGSTTGTVKLIDGSTIYVTDSSGNIVKVTTGSSTSVSIASTGTVSQLQPGQTVTVRGATDSSGDLAATSVTEGASAAGSGGGFGGGGFGGGAG